MNHDELEKLHALKEAGHLTDEEFTAQKRAILAGDPPAASEPVTGPSTLSSSFAEAGDLIDQSRIRPFLLLIGIYLLLSFLKAVFLWWASGNSDTGFPVLNSWQQLLIPPGAGWINTVFILLLYVHDAAGPFEVLWYVRLLVAITVQLGVFGLVLFRPIQRFSVLQQAAGVGLTASVSPLLIMYSSYLELPPIIECVGAIINAAVYAAIIYWLLTGFGRTDAAAARSRIPR